MSDFYTIIFLVSKTGNRIVINGVSAEIERTNDFRNITEASGLTKRIPTGMSYLEIILEMATIPSDQYQKLSKELLNQELYLYFKDTHPNLIKGMIKGITVDSHITTIKFSGNVTDKEYLDYVTDVQKQLAKESKVFNWGEESELPKADPIFSSKPSPPSPPGFKKKVHFKKDKKRKDKIPLKRKLTF